MRLNHKHIAMLIAFFLLLAPLIGKVININKHTKLKGAVEVIPNTSISAGSWFSGDYQLKKEKYLSNSFGWRNLMVRINNQLHYSLFGTIRANSVVEGKNGYLFETGYIDAYLGTNFIGKEKIIEKVRKLKAVNQAFAELDKHLLVVLAAGKGTYYPQYFPEEYDARKKGLNNYEYYAERLQKESVPFIDFNQHFLDIRDTTRQVLYPKSGIHWSRYGEVLVMDSLLQYFEKAINKDVPELKRTWVVESTPLKRDNDLEKGMNLLFSYDNTKMTYQAFEFEKSGKHLPVVLFIADSFYWGLQNEGFTNGPFKDSHFWFYNQSVWPQAEGKKMTKDLNFKEEIDKREIVILLGAEATLTNFAYGAIDQLYETYVVPKLDSPKSLPN